MALNAKDQKLLEKYKSAGSWHAECCVCSRSLDPAAGDTEMSKAKSGSINFFHRDCLRKWGECGAGR